ncbi:MAG: monovalent cation:proton antiporter-2 (CPA2) family protein [Deltaproteobacteria bacterium]|nr:monovalent cation:proton antiporter-2 (CPA2) family protein [Deltaproteobacteria bacterium]
MQEDGLFFQAFVYLSAAVISVPVAKRLGLGSVLGYLIAGFAIGPFGFQLIGEEGQDVMHFAEFGVVMMLFLIGLELQPSLLWRLRGPILGMGGLQVTLTTGAITSIGIFFGLPLESSLAVGMTLALSSTAIVLQTLNEKGLMKTDAGQSAFSVLLFQDIAVIPMLAIMPLLAVKTAGVVKGTAEAHGGGTTWVEGLSGWGQALMVVSVIAFIIIAGLFLIRPFFRYIAKTRLRELFTAAALLLVIGISLVMTKVGLSPALGTFLAGVVLANSEYRHELEGDIEPFKGLLLGLFFIAVGASIDFTLITEKPDLIGMLVAGLIILKLVILLIVGKIFKIRRDHNVLFAFSLAQGGEFAFVLFSFAVQSHVIDNTIANPLIGAVALSMALTPLALIVNDKLIQPRFGTHEKEEIEADSIDEENQVIIAGFGNFGSIVGRLLRANDIGITVLEHDSDRVELLRKLGLKVFFGDASRKDLLHSAGAEKARILILAFNDHGKTIDIVHMVKKHYPHLTIFTRSSGRTEVFELLDEGVHHVYRETFDTSLKVGIDALTSLGFRAYQAQRAARTFRHHDVDATEVLRHVHHDKKTFITLARQRIEDLEQLMLSDLKDAEEHPDTGWDTTYVMKEFGEKNQEKES